MFWFVFILIFSFVFTCLKGSFLNPSSKGGAMYTSLSSVWGGPCTENASLSHFSKKANFPILHMGGWCTNGDWRLSVNPGQECLWLDRMGSGEGHFPVHGPQGAVCLPCLVREGADSIIRPHGVGAASGSGLGHGTADPEVVSESSLKLIQRIQA